MQRITLIKQPFCGVLRDYKENIDEFEIVGLLNEIHMGISLKTLLLFYLRKYNVDPNKNHFMAPLRKYNGGIYEHVFLS